MKRRVSPDRAAALPTDAPSRRVPIWSKHMKSPSTILSLNKFRISRRAVFFLAMSVIVLATLTVVIVQEAATDLFWNTNGVSASWTSANWGTTSGGPFTTAWTADKNTEFTANSTVTFATTSIGDVKV